MLYKDMVPGTKIRFSSKDKACYTGNSTVVSKSTYFITVIDQKGIKNSIQRADLLSKRVSASHLD